MKAVRGWLGPCVLGELKISAQLGVSISALVNLLYPNQTDFQKSHK